MRVVEHFANLSAPASLVRGDFFLREKVAHQQCSPLASIGKMLVGVFMVTEADFAEQIEG
jgi:hypothetical protein